MTCAQAEITSLPEKAVQAAASLLNLMPYLQKEERTSRERSLGRLYRLSVGRDLMKEPDYNGLDAAIENYKQAMELDPRYAVAYAKLARAYGLSICSAKPRRS